MIENKRDVRLLELELNYLRELIDKLSEDEINQRIEEAWGKLKIDAGNERLKSMPIDTISTLEKGLPINVLVNHGFRTIYDIKDQSPHDLMELNLIGEVSAYRIHDAVTNITDSVFNQARPRINPDDLVGNDINLLELIYKKWKSMEHLQALEVEYEELHTAISPAVETAKTQKNFIVSLFQTKGKKEKIKAAFEELNRKKYKEKLSNMKNKLEDILHFSIEREELVQHFIEENASYYTEIEKTTGYEQKEMEDLPEGIVEAVNNFPLNTIDLDVSLRHYQEFGAKYALYHKRTLLGDEMGLGKTIQALAIINHLNQHDQKYAMVVCPLSVLANWKREIHERSKLNTYIFHGNNRDNEFEEWQSQSGVLITTYEQTLRMNFKDEHILDALVVDEAHYVKNPDTKRSKSVYNLTHIAEYVLFMSGTPLENRLEEMKQLIGVLQPEISEQLSRELHLLHPTEFKQLVAPVYLRRNRKDVLVELPELEVIPQWGDFGQEEQRVYVQAVVSGQLMLMRRAAWLGGSPEKSPKLARLLDICAEAEENGHKVLVFSFFRDVIQTIQLHLEGKTFEAITGDVPNARRQEIIDEFSKAKPGSVLVSQITAGGVGLNIQAANIVVLCEPQWKPSIEEQAISRAYRMGQSRNVIVYRLLTEDSIDATMLEVLGEKSKLFNLYARDSDVATLALSDMEDRGEELVKKKVLEMERERVG